MSRYTANFDFQATPEIKELIEENINSASEKIPSSGNWRVIYGYDNTFGYFVQFERSNAEEDNDLIDIDSLSDSLTGSGLGFILETVGVKSPQLERSINNCYLDLVI